MTLPEPSPPRRRGAPSGNLNAVKHGFYSSRFHKSERTALDANEFSGVSEEIAMLRLFIRRVVTQSSQIEDVFQLLECLRVLSLASSSLARLVKVNAFLASSGESEIAEALRIALDNIDKELEGGVY